VLIPVLSTSSFAGENLPRNLAYQRLEGRNRQAAAAGIFDEGGIMAVGQRRPDQRVDLFRHPGGEPFGLDAVGVEGEVEAVLFGGGANRQYGRRAITDAPRDFVPMHALDEVAIGVYSHSPTAPLHEPTETSVKSPAVIQPCR
jgi:hypothetical protein